jgi:hypothetical protein
MSEHQIIADLLADLLNEQRATTAAVSTLAQAIAGTSPVVKAEAVIAKAKKTKQEDEPTPPTLPPATPVPSAEVLFPTNPIQAGSPAAEVPVNEVSYNELSAAVLSAVKKDRTGILALFAKLGVKSAKEIKPAQYADVLAQVVAI